MKQLLFFSFCLSSSLIGMEISIKEQNITSKLNPLIAAAQNNELETLDLLLRETVDPNTQDKQTGFTALGQAAYNNHEEAIELLLKHEASPNVSSKDSITPLIAASYNGNITIASDLINHGALIDTKAEKTDGLTALHAASQKGHVKMVELLLNAGADKIIQDKHGRTPLMHAAKKSHSTIIQLLCENKVSTSITDKEGQTALHRPRSGK